MKGGTGSSMHYLVLSIRYGVLETFLAPSRLMILECDSLQHPYKLADNRTTEFLMQRFASAFVAYIC
jgi:hypothetical protein